MSIPEPSVDTIALHNGLSAVSDIAGMTGIPSLGTALASVISAPTTISATTPHGLRTFDWSPTSQHSWAVIASVGAEYTAYEIDSPFGAPWAMTEASGR